MVGVWDARVCHCNMRCYCANFCYPGCGFLLIWVTRSSVPALTDFAHILSFFFLRSAAVCGLACLLVLVPVVVMCRFLARCCGWLDGGFGLFFLPIYFVLAVNSLSFTSVSCFLCRFVLLSLCDLVLLVAFSCYRIGSSVV